MLGSDKNTSRYYSYNDLKWIISELKLGKRAVKYEETITDHKSQVHRGAEERKEYMRLKAKKIGVKMWLARLND